MVLGGGVGGGGELYIPRPHWTFPGQGTATARPQTPNAYDSGQYLKMSELESEMSGLVGTEEKRHFHPVKGDM